MVRTTLLVSIALAGLAMSVGGAMAVPFCTPTASSLSYGIGNNGRIKRNYDDEISHYTSELNQRGYDTTLVETWNGCVRAWVRNGGKEEMMFFDPNTFREVH